MERDDALALQRRKLLFERFDSGLRLYEPLAERKEVSGPVGDCLHKALHPTPRVGELARQHGALSSFPALPLHGFLVILTNVGGNRLGIEQPFAQAGQHALLIALVAYDPGIVAAGAVPHAGAAPIVRPDAYPAGAARTAPSHAGQQMFAAHLLLRLDVGPPFELFLDPLPQGLLDNAKVWDCLHGPGLVRVGANTHAARDRLDDLARPVVDQLASIEAVSQHAVPALQAPKDRCGFPQAAARSGNALRVQPLGNRAARLARRIFVEDTDNDRGLIGFDLAQTAYRASALVHPISGPIAISESRGRAALGDAAALRALDVVREFLALLLVEKPFDGTLEGVDLSIGQREEAGAAIVQPVPDMVSVALIPRDAAGGVGKNLINAASLDAGEQRVHSRALVFRSAGRAANRRVTEDVDHLPTFEGCPFHADPDLIFDRSAVLKLAAVPRIDKGSHLNRLSATIAAIPCRRAYRFHAALGSSP